MDPNEPTAPISEEEYRRRVLQLLETMEAHLDDIREHLKFGTIDVHEQETLEVRVL